MKGATVILIGLLCLGAAIAMGQLHPRGCEPLLEQASTPAEDHAGDGDATRGKAVFEKRCVGCHALDADRKGPHLAGVFGRKAGSVPGFSYSTSLKKSGVVWDEANLERWLTDPDIMVPENDMSVRVPKAQDRKDLVAFLKSTGGR